MYNAEPAAKVSWMKGGVEVRQDCDTCISTLKTQSQTSLLEITPYTKEDFGDYECRVRNKYGSIKLKISLKKSGKQPPPQASLMALIFLHSALCAMCIFPRHS